MTTPYSPDTAVTTPDMVALLDDVGAISYLSDSVADTLGYRAADLMGTNVLNLIHVEERARAVVVLAAGQKSLVSEFGHRHRDGSWRRLQVTIEHLPATLGSGCIVYIARDVTGRRQHDERLRLLESVAVHANDAILITDAEPIDLPGPRILYANQAFLRTTGYTLAEVVGQSPRILQGPDTARESRDAIRKALKKWRPIVVQLLNYRKDGSTFWVELSIVPVTDTAGWYTHWVSIQRDITKQRETEQALRIARDDAEAANLAKSQFLSRMSHELRTPLNGILGFAQILQLDPAAVAHRGIADDLYNAGQRLLALINEVLDISRVEAGELPLSMEPVLLAEVVRACLSVVAPMAALRSIETLAEVDAGACVQADRHRLGQVLLNLLSNAVKYNREGGSVAVAAALIGNRVRVEVTDSGPGIPADKANRLFIPFDRLGAETSGVEGTGLGLALTKRLVEAMGGAIGAINRPGRGATFWFELPVAQAPAAVAPVAEGPGHDALPAGSHFVLYIEDNPANYRLIELALAHRPGVRLMAAPLGRQGVELAARLRPDLVLLDLHLPDISGEEVFRQLKAAPGTRDIPVVVLSADAMPDRTRQLRAAGAAEYLTKPLERQCHWSVRVTAASALRLPRPAARRHVGRRRRRWPTPVPRGEPV